MPNELTNPNNVVTEERLAQFYQQILPYLGGMPDVLANKFSKADLYSTDEKLIGRWIDGKPLYQKVLTGLNFAGTTGAYTNVSSALLPIEEEGVIETLVNARTRRSSDNMDVNPIDVRYYNGKLQYWAYHKCTGTDTLTLQYTKTTDSAVEIGSDTDYSTTEKIVGTWIDGKPIYKKTVETTSPNKDTTQYTPIGASIDTVVNYVAMFKNTSGTVGHNNWIKAASAAHNIEAPGSGLVVQIYGNDASDGTPNSACIRHNMTGWGGKPLCVTIYYTKTS